MIDEDIVSVRTSVYKTKRGLSVRRDVSVMRKFSGPRSLLFDDMSAGDASDTAERILNLHEVGDGLFRLVPVNVKLDWESGCIDNYDFKLEKFQPTEAR